MEFDHNIMFLQISQLYLIRNKPLMYSLLKFFIIVFLYYLIIYKLFFVDFINELIIFLHNEFYIYIKILKLSMLLT